MTGATRLVAPFRDGSGAGLALAGLLAYVLPAALLTGLAPAELFDPEAAAFLLVIGTIGVWRYAWAALHLARAATYLLLDFPRLRRHADRVAARPGQLAVLVTSYRLPTEVTAAVYDALFAELARFGVAARVFACLTDVADAAVVEALFRRRTLPDGSAVVTLRQDGRGKRAAMAAALRRIAAEAPPPDGQVVLMDGDSLLARDCLRRACGMLAAMPAVAAVTADNRPKVAGGGVAREWYRLRMAQRRVLMASLSLSRRLLVLTGRFSVIRAGLATDPGFILAVEDDALRHWRLGRIDMLTGDDKSTWFWLLERGGRMLFVADALVHPLERLPPGGFVVASTALMRRWYGNMLRNNARALTLGPRRCGGFLWLALLDQRLSIWTTLTGPAFFGVAALLHGPVFLVVYGLWILFSRGLASVALFAATGRFHPLFPLLLFYNQIAGALVKLFISFHLDRQRWTRQGIAAPPRPVGRLGSDLLALAALAAFVLAVGAVGDLAGLGGRQILR